jgi:hypothetical protein
MLIKLDLSKSFDSLNWNYILNILAAFGFSEIWIQWVHSLISTTFFSILVNGSPSPTFSPTRGIHQGDPLSPFLFILMEEGLGRDIKEEVALGNWKGISLHGEESPASHQQFVDDTMLMASPTLKESLTIKQVLHDFSEASGMCVNEEKSNIFFFNTPQSIQHHLTGLLGFQPSKLPSKYLGVPLTENSLKKKIWEDLLDKMEKKLGNWSFCSLNIASRLILIKSFLQAIPIYHLSVIAAPKYILRAIRNIQRDFLWGSSKNKKKWALVAWETVCLPKLKGGLGLRDPETSAKPWGIRYGGIG